MKKLIVIPTDKTETCRLLEVQDDMDELNLFQSIVGGYVELVKTIDSAISMFANEDGLRLNLNFNDRASKLASRRYGSTFIVGDVVIMGAMDEDGECKTVPDEYVATFIPSINATTGRPEGMDGAPRFGGQT